MKVIPFKVPKASQDFIRYQVDDQPYFYDKLHQHPELQLSLVLEGEGRLIGGDYIGRFAPGDVFLLGHDVPHVFRSDEQYYAPGTPAPRSHAVFVFIDLKALSGGIPGLTELQEVKRFCEQLTGCYQVQGPVQVEITRQVQALPPEAGLGRLLGVLHIIEHLMQPGALRCLSAADQMRNLSEREGQRMQEVLNFLMAHSHRTIALNEVAAVANMSREAFCRFFKERTRKTYVHYLQELRLTNACQLLLHTNQTVASIAFACGFANLSHFNRVFAKLMGTTPRAYRLG
jgi:AraC-like DNA-binding protein